MMAKIIKLGYLTYTLPTRINIAPPEKPQPPSENSYAYGVGKKVLSIR